MRHQSQEGAGEDIHQAGKALGSDSVLAADLLGDGAGDDDTDGVVDQSGGQNTGQQADAVLGAAAAADLGGDGRDQPLHTAVVADQTDDTGDEDGHD